MINPLALLPFLLLLSACALYPGGSEASDYEGYFADASTCYHAATQKEQIKVPTGKFGMTVIDIPIVQNAGAFSNCMTHAGHTPPKVDPQEYLEMSSRCLKEASGTENPDESYGLCIKAGKLSIETVIDEKAK